MEQIFIESEGEKFSIEFEEINGWYRGNVYPVFDWANASGDEGWSYTSKSDGTAIYDTLNNDCRIMFAFAFVWRGVWEGRIYFKDDEYWSEEIRVMADLWDKIEPILKDKIREKNPERYFEED